MTPDVDRNLTNAQLPIFDRFLVKEGVAHFLDLLHLLLRVNSSPS